MTDIQALDPFFAPQAVAVIGASSRPESVGYAVLKNLLYGRIHPEGNGGLDRQNGFNGPVYAVNHKGGEILGQPVHKSLADIGEPVDLMVVAIPPKYIDGLIDEAAAVGIKAGIIISAGFAEMGDEGRALQEAMAKKALGHGMRLIGPNCLGVIRPSVGLNASFADHAPAAGPIGLLSQSGALVTGLISYADLEALGLSAAVSLGAKADVEDEDILSWFAQDEATRAVALYAESFPEPRKTFQALAELSAKKPVVAVKGGSSAAGAHAAASHTGALAGSSAAYRAAFAQSGVIEARTVGQLLTFSRALSCQPPAAGPNIAIVTNAGGPGVLSTDEAERWGLKLAELSTDTLAALDGVLPSVWSRGNPVDVIGDATPERYTDALNILGQAPEVDGIVLIMTVQAMTDPSATARAIADAAGDSSWTKPLTCSFIGLIGTETGQHLDAHGIPEFNMPEQAIWAMSALVERGRWLAREEPEPYDGDHLPVPDHGRAADAIAKARQLEQENLDLGLATEVLSAAGIRYNQSGTAADADAAVELAERIGFPVVVKVLSPDVVHKSDAGGVVLDLVDGDAVRQACQDIIERIGAAYPEARITGFTVEEQVKGTEVIVGMSRDGGFGSLLMVGMGGIFVEVYKDVSFRLLPVSRRDALDMIGEIKAQPLLNGARGRPTLDRAELAEVMVRISDLIEAHPEIREVDLNPLVITKTGLVAIDARVILSPLE